MKYAVIWGLSFLLLFGPWFVWLAERKQIRWLKPVSYFCLFLGPALAVLGIVNYLKMQARKAENIKAGGTVRISCSSEPAAPTQKSPPQTPPP